MASILDRVLAGAAASASSRHDSSGGVTGAGYNRGEDAQMQRLNPAQREESQQRRARNAARSVVPSLLYNARQVAVVDLQTLLSMASVAVEELIRIDSRFDAYKAPLFSDQTLHLDRSLLEPEAARLLNKTLKGFLALVSNYILLPVTLKALEWLVRRFQIHQVNVDDLMGCALPFHETSVFVKIGQVCALEGSKWTFLLAPILQGYPVSRDVIVNRAAKDLGFLESIWERARVLGAPSIGCKTYAAFYSAVTVETIHTLTLSYTQQNFPKMFVPRLLPYLLDGLDSVKAGVDHSAATYLILSTLMRTLRLTPTLVSSLVEALFRSPHEALFGQAVMLLSGIITTTATAQYLQAMPKKALGALVNRAPMVISTLEKIVNSSDASSSSALASFLVCQCLQRFCNEPNPATAASSTAAAAGQFAVQVVDTLDLSSEHVRDILETCIACCKDEDDGDGGGSISTSAKKRLLCRIVHTLQRKKEKVVDQIVSELCAASSTSPAAVGSLTSILRGTLQHLVQIKSPSSGAASEAETRTVVPLMLALDHPSSAVRLAGVGQVQEGFATAARADVEEIDGDDDDERQATQARPESATIQALGPVLLRRIQDDSVEVLSAVLNTKQLIEWTSSDDLLSAVSQKIATIRRQRRGQTSTQASGSEKNMLKLMIHFLSIECASFYSEDVVVLEKILLILIDNVYAFPAERSIVKSATAPAIKRLGHPICAELATPITQYLQRLESSSALEKSKPKSKQSRASFDAEFNLALAKSLARNSLLLSDPDSFLLKMAQSPSFAGLLVLREWLLLAAQHADSPKQQKQKQKQQQQQQQQQQLAQQVITHLIQYLWKTGAKDGKGGKGRIEEDAEEDEEQEQMEMETETEVEKNAQDSVNDPDVLANGDGSSIDGQILAKIKGLGKKAKARRILEWYCTSALCQAAAALDDRLIPAAPALQESVVDVCSFGQHLRQHLHAFLNKLPASRSSSHFVRIASKPIKAASAQRVLAMVEWVKTVDIAAIEDETALRIVLGLVILMRSKLRDVRKAAIGVVAAAAAAAARMDKLEVLLTALTKDRALIIESEEAVKRVFATLNETRRQRRESSEFLSLFTARAALLPTSYAKWAILSSIPPVSACTKEASNALRKTLAMCVEEIQLSASQPSTSSSKAARRLACAILEMIGSATEGGGAMNAQPAFWIHALLDILSVGGRGEELIRTALDALSDAFYKALDVDLQWKLLEALVRLGKTAPAQAIRQRAQRSIRDLDTGVGCLSYAISSQAGRPARERKRKKQRQPLHLDPLAVSPSFVASAITVLEILRAKADLIASFYDELQQLLVCLLSAQDTKAGGKTGDGEEEEAYEMSADLKLAKILCLGCLESGVSIQQSVDDSVDISIVGRCISECREGSVVSAALSCLATIASIAPHRTFEYTFMACETIAASTLQQDDAFTQRTVTESLKVLVPAWLQQGDEPVSASTSLLRLFITHLESIPKHRHVLLLEQLLTLLPFAAPISMRMSLKLLLERCAATSLVSSTTSRRDNNNSNSNSNSNSSSHRRHRSMEMDSAQARQDASDPVRAILPQLCQRFPWEEQMQACSSLLEGLILDCLASDAQEKNASILVLGMDFIVEHLDAEANRSMNQGNVTGLDESYQSMMKSAVQILSDRRLKPGQAQAKTLLAILAALMKSDGFLIGLGKLMEDVPESTHMALGLVSRSFRQSVDYSCPAEEWQALVDATCLKCVGVVLHSSSPSSRLDALTALDVMANYLSDAEFTSASLVQSLPGLSELLESANNRLRSKCMVVIASIVQCSKSLCIPFLSTAIPRVLQLMTATQSSLKTKHSDPADARRGGNDDSNNNNDDDDAPLLYLCCLQNLARMLETLAGLLSPYLEQIVVISATAFGSEWGGDAVHKASMELVQAIPTSVELRVLIDPLEKALARMLEMKTKRATTGELLAMMEILNVIVTHLDKTQVPLYTSRLVDLVLTTIAHSKRPDSSDATTASPTVQSRAIDAIVALTMKLSERMFRPLISRIQEWATAGSGTAAADGDDDDGDDGGDEEQEDHSAAGDGSGVSIRFLSFVQLIDRLVQDLRSLFCPYFEYFLDMFLDTLRDFKGATTAAASKQKRKRLKLTEEKTAAAAAAHLSEDELRARCHIVNALYHLVLYDKGSILDDSAKVLALVEPLTKQLQVRVADPSADNPSWQALITATQTILAEICVVGNREESSKFVTQKLLALTRKRRAQLRGNAVDTLRMVVARLKEEYLPLLPETVPFLAELLEDADQRVEDATQALLRDLEVLSGESLKSYLQ